MEESSHERRRDTVDRSDQNGYFGSELGRTDPGMSGERQDGEGVVRGERHPGRDLLLSSAADLGNGIDEGTASIPADRGAIGGDTYCIRRDQHQPSRGSKSGTARGGVRIAEVMLKELSAFWKTGISDLKQSGGEHDPSVYDRLQELAYLSVGQRSRSQCDVLFGHRNSLCQRPLVGELPNEDILCVSRDLAILVVIS